ncbi:MAG: hypothetical protein HRU17_07605 [Polyangiaceae bacterium]|nr:hypothetical protein [Polyangiaceae bacterium]
MSGSELKNQQLSEAADALLKDWSVPERSESEWEASAKQIEERISQASTADDGDLDILAAPLPQNSDDGALSDLTTDDDSEDSAGAIAAPPLSDPRSLAAMARDALEADPAKEDYSEVVRESLSIAQKSQPPVGPAGVAPPKEPAPSSVPAISERSEAVAHSPESTTGSSRGEIVPGPWSRFGTVGAAIAAIAAGCVLYMSAGGPDAEHTLAQAPAETRPTSADFGNAAKAPPLAGKLAEDRSLEGVVKLDDGEEETSLEEADNDSRPSTASLDSLPKASPRPVMTLRETKGSVPTARRRSSPKAKPQAPRREPQPTTKKMASRSAPPNMRPAEQTTALPTRPSLGAIQAAIGRVLGQARACVAGQTRASTGHITFGSDGRVKSVRVTGPAADSPSETCIRSALSQARVGPFSQDTVSTSISVRPR